MDRRGPRITLGQGERHLLQPGKRDPVWYAQVLLLGLAADTAIGDPVSASTLPVLFDHGEVAPIPAVESERRHALQPPVPRIALAVHQCCDGSLVGLFTDLVPCHMCIPGPAPSS